MEWYNSEIIKNFDVELIWFSRDDDKRAMEQWMNRARMPWPMVEFRYRDKIPEVTMHAGGAVPFYVLVNANNTILAKGRTSVMKKVKELTSGS